MQLVGSRGQQIRDFIYRADGSVLANAATGTLVLPEAKSRSYLSVQNISAGTMWLEIGSARATATLTAGVVTSVAVNNGGFGFTRPPVVEFYGGGDGGNPQMVGAGLVGWPVPGTGTISSGRLQHRPAKARAVLTAGVVTSIVVDDGGLGYVITPQVFIRNSELDPNGVADPAVGAGSGIFLGSGQNFFLTATVCTTDPVAVWGAGAGAQKFTCLYMP
jgi:hypothetical protein